MTDRRLTDKFRQLTDQAVQLRLGMRWSMLPSTGVKKGPCVDWKVFQRQFPTPEQIRQWGVEFKPERWGVVTGEFAGIVVVDFDGDQGRDLMQKWGVDPHVRTGSGGFHWYLRHPGWHVPTLNAKTGKVSWPWPGVDIRGDGGFAVLLGRNADGSYEQLRELIPEPFDGLPEEVRAFLRNHGKANSTQAQLVPIRPSKDAAAGRVPPSVLIEKALAIADGGGRNNGGIWLACQLRDNGFSIEDAGVAMRDYRSRTATTNTKGKVEPYTQSEISASLRQAYSRPARNPWDFRKPRPHDNDRSAAALPKEPGKPPKGDSPPRRDKTDLKTADDPEYLDLHVGPTGGPLVVPTRDPLSSTRFARIPEDVFADRKLTHRDIRVFSILSFSCWPNNISAVGKRRIMARAHCSGRSVRESLGQLELAGHILQEPKKRGQRGSYVLLSPIFAQKQPVGADEVATASDRLAPAKKHPQTEVVSQPRPASAQRKSQ